MFRHTFKHVHVKRAEAFPSLFHGLLGNLGATEPLAYLWQRQLDGRQRRSFHEQGVTIKFGQIGQQSSERKQAVFERQHF